MVIADYKAEDKTQVSLKAGENVEVAEKNENGKCLLWYNLSKYNDEWSLNSKKCLTAKARANIIT